MSDIQTQVAKCRNAAIMFREEMARLVDIAKHQCTQADHMVQALSGKIPEPTINHSASELIGVAELASELRPNILTIAEKLAETQPETPTNGKAPAK